MKHRSLQKSSKINFWFDNLWLFILFQQFSMSLNNWNLTDLNNNRWDRSIIEVLLDIVWQKIREESLNWRLDNITGHCLLQIMTNTTVSADHGSPSSLSVSSPRLPQGPDDAWPPAHLLWDNNNNSNNNNKYDNNNLLCDAPVADPRRPRHLHRPPPWNWAALALRITPAMCELGSWN